MKYTYNFLAHKLKDFAAAFGLDIPSIRNKTGISNHTIRNIWFGKNNKLNHFYTIAKTYNIDVKVFTNTNTKNLDIKEFLHVSDIFFEVIKQIPHDKIIDRNILTQTLSKMCFLHCSNAYNDEELEKFISSELDKTLKL